MKAKNKHNHYAVKRERKGRFHAIKWTPSMQSTRITQESNKEKTKITSNYYWNLLIQYNR